MADLIKDLIANDEHYDYVHIIYIYIYICVYYRFIVRFPIGLDFLFITYFLHFFLSWRSSLSISTSVTSASTLYNHVLLGSSNRSSAFNSILHTFRHSVLVTFPHHRSIPSQPTTFNNSCDMLNSNQRGLLSFMEIPHIHLIICITAPSNFNHTSDMLDELGCPPLSQRRHEARLIMFYKIINRLAQVPFESVLIEVYKSTRRKHNLIYI